MAIICLDDYDLNLKMNSPIQLSKIDGLQFKVWVYYISELGQPIS